MSWQAPKLRHRIQIRTPTQTHNDEGGFDRGYTTLTTIWAQVRPLKGIREYVQYIRGQANTELPTNEIMVRSSALSTLGGSYSKAFSTAFDLINDITKIKSDYFIFLQKGSITKGILFRIMDMKRDDEHNEYMTFRVKEIEEHGTGYSL